MTTAKHTNDSSDTLAAGFRQQLEEAQFLSHIGPIKNAIETSALSLDEQAALLKFAKEREESIYQNYLGRSMYPAGRRAGD